MAKARMRVDQANASVPEATFSEGVAQGGLETTLDNLLGIPEFVARGGRGMNNIALSSMGYEMKPIPQEGLLGLPSGREAAAGIDTALGKVGMGGLLSVSPNFDENLARRERVAEQAPVGDFIGSTATDAGFLALGRAPLMQGKTGGIFDEGIEAALEKASQVLGRKAAPTGSARFTKEIIDNETVRKMARGVGRAGETSLEGLTIAVLKGGDPFEAALMSGGAQLASSVVQTATGEIFEFPEELVNKDKDGKPLQPKTLVGKARALAINGAIYGGLYQILNSALPGGVDSVLQSEESGYNKVLAMLALGAAANIVGQRTSEDSVLAAYPVVADYITSIPRTAMTGFIADMSKPDAPVYEKVLERIQQAPEAFPQDQMDRLLEGLKTGSFGSTVDELQANKTFFDIVNAPDPRLAGVPKDDD